MWVKAGTILLNTDKLKVISLDPINDSGKMYMKLNAFVEGVDEPVLLAMTPAAEEPGYKGVLLSLKSYIKAIHRGIDEGWKTYELGQPVSGLSADEE